MFCLDARLRWHAMARVIVVKLGTNLVTDAGRRPDAAVLCGIARQVGELFQQGRRVAVVSSGAVGAGTAVLGLARRPTDLAELQAAAAAGQPVLMKAWAEAFVPVGLKVGQVLITREDADDRGRFLNFRNTVAALWRLGAVPIINENDTVSTDELTVGAASFGDNDRLAAVAASALSAELLVLLSTVPGLLDEAGRVVSSVSDVNAVAGLARRDKSTGGTGGMASKLAAARLVVAAGETLVIADGRAEDVLLKVVAGEPVGTRFLPGGGGRRLGRSRWIASAVVSGRLLLDAGAAEAVSRRNASLLPAGVVGVEGHFRRGDVVELAAPDGRVIARGLCNYDAAAVGVIRGRRTADLAALLDDGGVYDEVVHRDQMVFP